MYLGYNKDNKIVVALDVNPETLPFTYNVERWEHNTNHYQQIDGEYIEDSKVRDILINKYKVNIAMLKMTPLDFIKVLEELGLTWVNLKAIMTQYPDVEKELTMCQFVYRGNPLLNQMIPMVNKTFGLSITEQQLDLAFAKKNNREDLLEGGKD